jgi:hypothetical protein
MTSRGLLRPTDRKVKEKVGCDWRFAGWRGQVGGLRCLLGLIGVCVCVCMYFRPEEVKQVGV